MYMSQTLSMTAERWDRLRSLYEEAQAIAPERRLEFILNTCDDDPALREQLVGLVMASGSGAAFDETATRIGDMTFKATAELPPGHVIGRYTIVRLIGQGGMGSVYLAERSDREFEQRVAIKVVASGVLSSRIMARLRSERQILASLNHPNIARLFDGGATSEGTPFLAMEYVEGKPIDIYCEDRALDIKQRLELFLHVCSAVQYAHTQLVIHRDIKPSNILVTADGTPKLLDFGIAKLLDPNAPGRADDLTRVHERVMSPEHASPEQVRGERVGTASDVYALGVLLYQLLTRRKPYYFGGKNLDEIERVILEEVPPRPSAAVLNVRADEDESANETLAKALQGDLDTIVMKAMHKDAQHRYPTPGALAEDIERFLSSRPISARPDSLGYRVRKYWRRNRLPIAVGAVATFAIVAMTVLYAWRLTTERDIAERERLTATRVSEFMTEVFRVANPSESRGNTVPVREVLDSAVARIERDLREEPAVRVQLLEKMAQAYVGIGLWGRAESLLEDAVAQARASFGPRSLQLADTLTSLAAVQHRNARYSAEREALEEALSIRRAMSDFDDRPAVLALIAWAENEAVRGEVKDAEVTLQQARTLAEPLAAQDPVTMGEVFASYGRIYIDSSRYQEAEQALRQALPLLRGAIRQGSDRHADSALLLASTLVYQGKMGDAIAMLRELLQELEQVFGASHPLLGDAWNLLGIAHCESGEYEPCSKAFQQSADIERHQSADGTLRLAVRYANLGSAYHDAGHLTPAIEALSRAADLIRELSGATDPNLLAIYYEKASALRDAGDLAAAEATLALADPIVAQLANDHDRLKSFVAVERGRLLHARGRYAAAADVLGDALRTIAPEEKRVQASARLALGRSLLALRQCEPAIAELRQAHALRREAMPEQNWFIYEAESALGDALSRCGQSDAADPLLRHSLEKLRRLRSEGDFKIAEAQASLEAHERRRQRP